MLNQLSRRLYQKTSTYKRGGSRHQNHSQKQPKPLLGKTFAMLEVFNIWKENMGIARLIQLPRIGMEWLFNSVLLILFCSHQPWN